MHRFVRALSVAAAAPLLASAVTPAAPAGAAPQAPTPAPRHCLAEFTTTDRAGTLTTVFHDDRRFGTFPLKGTKVSPAPRFVEPMNYEPSAMTVPSMVVTRTGILQSQKHTVVESDGDTPVWRTQAPKRIGHGWASVRDIAIPDDLTAPYFFAVTGDRLNRYTLRVTRAGDVGVRTAPHAATAGFSGVRSLTWTRDTVASGVRADVLLGLRGGELVEYVVPRKTNPRVTTRVLARSGWGGVGTIDAGLCFTDGRDTAVPTSTTPILGRVGRDVRLYVDRDNTDGSGRDIANHGRIGTWPPA